MKTNASERQPVKSADRVLTLFELLGGWRGEMTFTELAEELQIPKSSLSQILHNLLKRDWLAYNHQTKVYSLGPAFKRLAGREADRMNLAGLVAPVLQDLTDRLGESSAFNIPKSHRMEVVAAALGNQRLTSLLRAGDRTPLYATSGGKVLLAFSPLHVLNDYLSVLHMQEAGENGKVPSPEALKAQLDKVRAEGIAFSFDEWTVGITGVARPVLTGNGELLGSINFAIPSSRFTDKLGAQASDALLRAVRSVASQL
ncbi:IclR family transcriptional regulator [Mesorhizobium sp. DCY119]|uniref:IclR family transcriptional regulator n=1 Tax=Mesorhizobium sp. DCY119 TaxID=2108445 RepID=UPI000E74791C|nr:IclR family transcriptional regulator [Mesorhizobium sp. DCY119]RJG40597.1 IclR family transcriptional regulator [Mesorhizobium sp. DCY119]